MKDLEACARIVELEAELAKVTESDTRWRVAYTTACENQDAAIASRNDALRRLGEMDRLFASSLLIVDHFTGSLWPREVQDAASAMLIDIRAAAALVEREGR